MEVIPRSRGFLVFLFLVSMVIPGLGCGEPCKPPAVPDIKPPALPVPPIGKIIPPVLPPVIGLPPVLPVPPIGKVIPPILPPVKPPVDLPPVKPPVDLPPVKPPVDLPPVKPPVDLPPVKPPVDLPPVLPPVKLPPVVVKLPPVGLTPPATKVPPVKPGKKPCPPVKPKKKETCPIDTLKLGGCANALGGLVHIVIGDPAVHKCCPVLSGLGDVEAAACLCTTLKLKALDFKIYVPIALQVLITCGKSPPPGFTCAV